MRSMAAALAAILLAACVTEAGKPESAAPAAATAELDLQPAATALPALAQKLMDAVPADASVWQHYLSDQAVYIGEDGDVTGKKETLAGFGPFPPGLSGSIAVQNPKVTDLGDVAVIVFDALEKETVFDQHLEVHYVTSQSWHRENGHWRLVVTQTNVRAQDPKRLQVDRKQLAAAAGTYALGSWRYTIELRNGDLFAGASPARMAPLIAVGDNVFVRQGDPLAELHIFVRGPDGRVERMLQRRKFADLSWKRVDAEKKKR